MLGVENVFSIREHLEWVYTFSNIVTSEVSI